ncbi:MAG TPA: RNA-directed DNA polymerase [Candidatus Paceibacterota bacterium]
MFLTIVGLRERERERERGVPIGNLTSQIFANVYMNEFDQFVKHELKVKNYIRYTDDFLIVSENEEYLKSLIPKLQSFLLEKLILELHPRKVAIRKYHQGIDFLGYVIFPHHCLLRARTRKRIFKNLKYKINNYKSGIITRETLDQSIQSYLAVLSHANAYKLGESLKNQIWFWLNE